MIATLDNMICNRIIWMLGVLLHIISPVLSGTLCGVSYCSGDSAYCCGVDDDLCCYYVVYDYWWFWSIWVFVLLMIVGCSYCCVRRHRLRTGYYLVPGPTRSAYGTVSVTTTTSATAPPAYSSTQYQPPPSVPVPPPQYQP